MQAYSTVNSYASLAFNGTFNRNTLISGVCQFLILLYIAKLSPNVPESVENVFKNVFFRIGIFTLIFLFAKIDFIVAVLLSFAFVITMNLIQNKSALESFGDYVKYVEEEGYEPFEDDEEDEYEGFDEDDEEHEGGYEGGYEGFDEDDEEHEGGYEGFDEDDEEHEGGYEGFDEDDEEDEDAYEHMEQVTGIQQSDNIIKVTPSVTNGIVTVPNVIVTPLTMTSSSGEQSKVIPNVIVTPLTMTSSSGEQSKVIPNVIVTKEPIKKVRKPFKVRPYNSCF